VVLVVSAGGFRGGSHHISRQDILKCLEVQGASVEFLGLLVGRSKHVPQYGTRGAQTAIKYIPGGPHNGLKLTSAAWQVGAALAAKSSGGRT
jgi:hypothetical protein